MNLKSKGGKIGARNQIWPDKTTFQETYYI